MENVNEKLSAGADGTRVRHAMLHLGPIYGTIVFIFLVILSGIAGIDPIKSEFGEVEVYSISPLIGFGLATLLFLLPGPILQPLVENAVKHEVGGTPGKVEILIHAPSIGQSPSLSVENDAPPPRSSRTRRRIEGTEIELKNVADRVAARFPGIDSFAAAGHFRTSFVLPLRLA